jgi:hypothetical protein
MQMAAEASLLDDPRFVEELAKLEALPDEDPSVFSQPVPTVAESPHPVVVADELPLALGPRTKGPQFVLAPPPTRRESSYRRTGRAVLRVRSSERDEQPADATENVSTTVSADTDANPDDRGDAPAIVRQAESPEADASLNAFPMDTKVEETRVRAPRRSSTAHPALAVVGFVLMMAVGAGAAALVFHDRVGRIVALWQSASR